MLCTLYNSNKDKGDKDDKDDKDGKDGKDPKSTDKPKSEAVRIGGSWGILATGRALTFAFNTLCANF